MPEPACPASVPPPTSDRSPNSGPTPSAFLDQVQSTKRPVVLTQHGRSAAVLLDVGVYEDLLDEVALLRDVRTAEGQIEAGKVAPHSVVARRLKARLLK
ncbi:MAG: type II toxin-antitoxin system Phd/YefM family antitoxin [Gemmatimonadetes bacterium]|nr:type II toxin-antitoxin system Phd/YefM family antitoxin [Gemmatimonadota bacterium]